MSEAPKSILATVDVAYDPAEGFAYYECGTWDTEHGDIPYTRTDLYEEAVRQRDMLLEAADTIVALNTPINLRYLAGRVEQVRKAMATPPLARGDVKTGKVITSAELIESTDTPEIRGAVAPEGGGRHT